MRFRALLICIATLAGGSAGAQAPTPTYTPEPKAEALLARAQESQGRQQAKWLARARRELVFRAQHHPTNVPTWQLLSVVTYFQQDYASFAQCQHQLHALNAGQATPGYWTAAEWSFGLEDYVAALEFIDFAEAEEGPSLKAASSRRNVYLRLYEGDSALQSVANYVATNPNDVQGALLYAQTLAELGGEEEAYMAYRHVLRNFPDVVDARWQFLRWAAGSGRWDEAKSMAESIWTDPAVAERAKVAYAASFLEEDPSNATVATLAVRWTEGLLAQDSSNPAFWALRGDIALWLGDAPTAEAAWRHCLAMPGGNEWPVYQQLMQLCLDGNRTEEFLRDAVAARKAHSQHPLANYFVGLAQFQTGALEAAFGTLHAGLALFGSDPEVREPYEICLGEVCLRLGKLVEFRSHFEQALALNPQNPTSRNNYAYLMAQPAAKASRRELAEAEAHALKAVELADQEPNFWDTVAAVYVAQGKFTKAREAMAKALGLGGLNTASVVERAGDIERALGATDEARRLYQHAQWLGNASTQLADKIAQLPTP